MDFLFPKARVSGLPRYEDSIVLCSFVLRQYQRVTGGQMDSSEDSCLRNVNCIRQIK